MGDNGYMSETIDPTLASAVDQAREAAVDAAGADVGEHLGAIVDGDRLVSQHFAALESGYRGWYWSVSISRAPDSDRVTVNDVVLLPGSDAVVAPDWTPYKDRIRPGDLSPGDVLPPEEDDVRLVPAWSAGDGNGEQTPDRFFAREIGLGREWVLSLEGREGAVDRWQSGDFAPDAPIAQQASGKCASCGFLVSLAGDLSDRFGVCANGQANADGRVVALAHGCGAHSGAKLKRSASVQKLPPHVLDTVTVNDDLESLAVPEPEPEPEPVVEAEVVVEAEPAVEPTLEGEAESGAEASLDTDAAVAVESEPTVVVTDDEQPQSE